MVTPFAFLQTGPDSLTCLEGALAPASCPRPGVPALFAPDFFLSAERPLWLQAASATLRHYSRAEWAAAFPPSGSRLCPEWGPPDERAFERGFASLRARLDAGVLRKGVPVTSIASAVAADAAPRLFRQLIARVPELPAGLMAYGLYLPAGPGRPSPEFLVGATPEILFDLDDAHRLATVAVAGTSPASEGPDRLAASAKERDEHQSVVDDLLARIATWGEVEASETVVRRFGELQHLVVEIRLASRDALDFEAVARRLHPTPALGVYPRGAAGSGWLHEIDPRGSRKRFGAPFGLRLSSGGGRCVVAIRNLQYGSGQLDIWAGCGVVAMSRYQDEWQEVLQKIQSVRTLWGV